MGENMKTAEQDQSNVNSVPESQLPSIENPTQSHCIGRKAKDKDHLAAITLNYSMWKEQILHSISEPSRTEEGGAARNESPAPRITASRPSAAMLSVDNEQCTQGKKVGCDFQLQAAKNITRVTATHTQNGRSVGHETAHFYEDLTVTALMRCVKSWLRQSSDIFRPTLRLQTLWRRYRKSFS